jgi:DNA (cytosine-5)-methyltransferase 1
VIRVKLRAIDLFCGAGGLTQGLRSAGFQVVGAIDCDDLAIESYRMNHPHTRVWTDDITQVPPERVMEELSLDEGELDLLAGCPPCQGFSAMRTHNGKLDIDDPDNELVFEFMRYARVLRPRALMMENVPALRDDKRLVAVRRALRALGYKTVDDVLNTADYGVPQRRRRFIMLGLLSAEPKFGAQAKRQRTVAGAIRQLPAPHESKDELHNVVEHRSEAIRQLIADIPKDGGSRSALPIERQLACHRKHDGYHDVYGRMAWDEPAPTITGGCVNPSKGRFLHPEQDRAITPREAALLQSFPPHYRFSMRRGRFAVAQQIGNALPPRFIERHARSLRNALIA